MRRLKTYLLVATAAVAATGRASAQDFNPVDPWPAPTQPKRLVESKRDPTIRRATLVEALDHKKRLADAKNADTGRYARFYHAMLDRGVYLAPSQFEAAFVSLAHTDSDLDHAARAAADAMAAAV